MTFRLSFVLQLVVLLVMRFYIMIKVRRSGGWIMPYEGPTKREGGRGYFILRVVSFFALL